MGIDLNKLKDFLDSEEGKKSMEEFFGKIEMEDEILNSQLQRFHEKHSSRFSEIMEKIIKKYSSDAYVMKWLHRGYEPPDTLYFFMFEYAKKYGRECTQAEYDTHANCFTEGIYYSNGYFFNYMQGQGSCIKVTKE